MLKEQYVRICLRALVILCATSWAAGKITAVKADGVVIVKGTRTLTLLNHGQIP